MGVTMLVCNDNNNIVDKVLCRSVLVNQPWPLSNNESSGHWVKQPIHPSLSAVIIALGFHISPFSHALGF
jgi:hypothetical protein